LGCPTPQSDTIEFIAENPQVSNLFALSENENPSATAIATGVQDVVEGVSFFREHSALFPILAIHWGA
jgi:hypothetical protein